MSDYFDRVERSLRDAVAERRHVRWYRRLAVRPARGVVVVAVCLVASGSALAASGVFRTGAPVAPEVAPLAGTNVGAPIPSSARLLAMRVADPGGGPPWGLRTIRTTRGLMCVQVGRIVDGRIGVLGKDGAFHDDGRFHPLSVDYLEDGGFNCGTEDANGNAFLNEEAFGVPADGLKNGEGEVSGGCYGPRPSTQQCPPSERRNISYGLLGPDATSITYQGAGGTGQTMATEGPDGAYLVVQRHIASACLRGPAECSGRFAGVFRSRGSSGDTGGPTLNAFGVVRSVSYRGGSSCRLPDEAEVRAREHAEETAFRTRLHARYPAVWRKLVEAEAHIGAPACPRAKYTSSKRCGSEVPGTHRNPRVLLWATCRCGRPTSPPPRSRRPYTCASSPRGSTAKSAATPSRAGRWRPRGSGRSTCSRAGTSCSCSST